MKKLVLLIVVGVFLCTSTSVLAAVTFDDEGPSVDTLGGVMADFKTSTNVSLIALSGVASYSAFSSHLQGTRVFGSSSQDSKLYTLQTGKDAGTEYTEVPTNSDSSEFDTGWDAL